MLGSAFKGMLRAGIGELMRKGQKKSMNREVHAQDRLPAEGKPAERIGNSGYWYESKIMGVFQFHG